MTITLTCKCGEKFKVNLEQTGQTVTCPRCGKTGQAPRPKNLVPASAPPPPEMKSVAGVVADAGVEAVASEEVVEPDDVVDAEIIVEPEEVVEVDIIVEEDEIVEPEETVEVEVVEVVEDDDEGGSYGLDASDGLASLHNAGPGMWGTVAVIRVKEQAHCLAYGCKGAWALAGQGSDVLTMNMKDYKKARSFEEHEAEVTSVALSSTEPIALSADDDGEIRWWELPSCKRKKKIKAHEGAILGLAMSPDGKYAVSGGQDSRIQFWELDTGKRLRLEHADWSDDDEEVTFVTFSRDGSKILAGGSEGRVCMWSVETGKRIKRFPGLDLPISCVRLSDEGGRVTATTQPIRANGLSYLVVSHWATSSGKPLNRLNLAVESIPCCIAPDQGGKRIILGGASDEPWMGAWNLEDGRCLHLYDVLKGAPLCLAVAPHNNRVLAALSNERLQVFGMETY
jgi:hypothetical protein